MEQQNETNFSSQRSAIPFGKFETGSDDIYPCNESMIGREGARAKLIDFLTNAGTRTAILITGRRGMGKSSFVNYCLKEYLEARIERYWRNDIGRTFSTLLWLLAISMLFASAFVMGSSVLKILLHNVLIEGRFFLWPPLITLFFCLAYPLFQAAKIYTMLFKTVPDIKIKFWGFVLAFAIVFLFVKHSLPESPTVTLSRFIVALATVYCVGELINVSSLFSDKWFNIRLGNFVLLGFALLAGYFTISFRPIITITESGSSYLVIFSNLIIAITVFVLGIINKVIIIDCRPIHLKKLPIDTAMDRAKSRYLFFGMALYLLPFFLYFLSNTPPFVINTPNNIGDVGWHLTIILVLLFTLRRSSELKPEDKATVKGKYSKRHIYTTAPLLLKAVFFILIGLYALCPLSKNPDLFAHPETKLAYIALIVITVALLFWLEYEWIIRPGQAIRRDKSTYLGKRPAYYEDIVHPETAPDILVAGEDALRKSRNSVMNYIKTISQVRERARNLERLTFLHYFNHHSLATLISTINLGFEELDHRSVIHAMLLDIREQYYDKFISLRSPSVFIRAVFGLFLAMILVTALAGDWFNVGTTSKDYSSLKIALVPYSNFFPNSTPASECISMISDIPCIGPGYVSPSTNENSPEKIKEYIKEILGSKGLGQDIQPKNRILAEKYCWRDGKLSYEGLPKVPRLLCELSGFYAEKILPFIYFELMPIDVSAKELPDASILSWSFDIRVPYYLDSGVSSPRMSLCIYHLLLFTLIFYLFRRLNRTFKLVPYSVNLEKIDGLLCDLTSTTTMKRSRELPIVIRWAATASGQYQENERSMVQEKLDPRLVELQFMSVLDQICHSTPFYLKPLQSGKRSPTVEITFVFDELDKLATDINSQHRKGDPDGNDSELHRLSLMKGLLSNMKRVITSSEARFIFLGGRLLHDDWLADGARRQPLLTSIFSDEIYLPSLLTDANINWFDTATATHSNSSPGNHSLNIRIEEYFVWQYYLARLRFEHWINRVWTPLIGLPEWDVRSRGFIQASYKDLCSKKDKPMHIIPIRCETGVE
jgi:hypothetical protein